jgi:hypothetical protein
MPVRGTSRSDQGNLPHPTDPLNIIYISKSNKTAERFSVSYAVATPIPVYHTEPLKNEVKTAEQYLPPKQLERKENKTRSE